MFHLIFYTPEIPGNTGNAIRLAAVTGMNLHLIKPLGFTFEDAHLRRAGLDYHDLADVAIHDDLDAGLAASGNGRVLAFTVGGSTRYTDVEFRPGDRLLFGPESVGLPDEVVHRPDIDARVRIPMIPGRRSLNLFNAAAVVVYEAWRQHGFAGAP